MLLVAVATWRAHREQALVDPLGLKLVGSVTRVDAFRTFNRSWRSLDDWRLDGFNCRCQQLGQFLLERVFQEQPAAAAVPSLVQVGVERSAGLTSLRWSSE